MSFRSICLSLLLVSFLGIDTLVLPESTVLAASSNPIKSDISSWPTVDRTVKALESGDNQAAGACIDYREMSRRCFLPAEWQALSESQKNEFCQSLESLVQKRYYPRWRKFFGKGSLSPVQEKADDKDVMVETSFTLGKKTQTLIWKLAGKPGKRKIISLAVDEANKDLLERLQNRVGAQKKRGDFGSLITWLKKKSNTEI